MEASIALRPKYAIGLIIDDSVTVGDLVRIRGVFSTIDSFITAKDGDLNDYILTGTVPKIRIKCYIAIGRQVPPLIKTRIQKATDGGDFIKSSQIMWFDGQNYTYSELEQRLRQWIGEDWGAEKIWIVDISSILTGNLLSKFQ